MNFELSTQQREVYETVGELARTGFAARVDALDRDAATPVENMRDLHDAGMLTLTIGKDFGGWGSGCAGEDPLLYLLAVEQTARVDMGTAQCLHIHCHGCHIVDSICDDSQRETILRPVFERGALLNATGSEPGRTARGMYKLITIADRRDGGWVVSGVKNYATLGDVVEYNILFAGIRDCPPPDGHLGLAVPKDARGVKVVEGSWDPLGMRSAVSPTLELDDVFVPDSLQIGKPGQFPKERWQAKFHLSFAAQYLGGMEGIFDVLSDYLPRRGTSGDAYAQLRMGEIRVAIDSTRWLIYRAADLWGQKRTADAELFSMVAKHRSLEAAVIVMDKAAQIAGSSAFLGGQPLHRFFRDMRIHTLHENLDRTAATIGQAHLGQAFDTTARL